MRDGTWASSSAITDGRYVFAFFESSGLYAYDMRGSLVWQKRFGDKSDITGGPAEAWTIERDTPYVPSPLLYDGVLYFLKGNSGILSVFEAKTGRPHYQSRRLEGIAEVYSSPVAARGRVYITGRDGTTLAAVPPGGTLWWPFLEFAPAYRLD